MKLNTAIKNMTTQIADILSLNDPSVYIYGFYVPDNFQYGWSDIDILVLTEKPISEQQADELVCLRQSITAAEPDNLFYRCFEGIKANIQFHYETIRKYAGSTGRSIYSFGWILDIARCIYTLRSGKIISKTAAGEWALQNRLQDLSEKLGNAIQQYADVLEEELKATSFDVACAF